MIREVESNIIKNYNKKVYKKNNNSINKNIEKATKNINLKDNKAITLIALVITIVVLLILARSKYCNANRREWVVKKCK